MGPLRAAVGPLPLADTVQELSPWAALSVMAHPFHAHVTSTCYLDPQ